MQQEQSISSQNLSDSRLSHFGFHSKKPSDSAFYKTFFSMYPLLVLQNVVTLSVNLADNMMLGAYGESALSGAAAVNQIQFVYQCLLTALGDGLVMFGSQYWGKKQLSPLRKIAASAMHFGLLLSAVLFLLVSIFPIQALRIFTTDSAILEQGAQYLSIIRFTYLFFAITQILLATLRSVEIVGIAFRLSCMALLVNCSINYLLIFGHFGFPQLGIRGAAIGTLTARILEVIVLLVYLFRSAGKKLGLHFSNYFHVDPVLTKDYLKTTAPMLVTNGLWGVNTALQTVILGHMTAAAIAANSVASTLYMLIKSTAVGASSTASVMIGKAVGSGDIPLTKHYSKLLQRLFLCIGVLSGITLFFIRIPILSIYDLQPATKEMANTFLIILSVICVGMTYQMPTNNGIIRGGGNALFVVKMDLISIWCIVLPLSFFMAFVMHASPTVVVWCLNAEVFYLLPEMVGLICKLLPEGSVGASGQNTVRFGVKTFINTEIIVDHEGSRAVECLQIVQIGNFADLAQDIEIFRCCKIRIHQQAGNVVGRKDPLHGLDFPIEASVIGAQLQDRKAVVSDFVRRIHFL